MKKQNYSLIILSCVAVLLFAPVVTKADLVDFATLNQDPWTLKINDLAFDPNTGVPTIQLYNLFNNYFGLTGDAAYTSSNDLYRDLGIKADISSWTALEGATYQAGFKSAGFQHELSLADKETGEKLTDASGNNLFDKMFPAGEGQYSLVNDVTAVPVEGSLLWRLDSTYNGQVVNDPFFSTTDMNSDAIIHFVALDVTELMRIKLGDDSIVSAIMFGVEDNKVGAPYMDYDYNDLSFVVTNFVPVPASTPEPASALIFGIGLVAIPFARRIYTKKNVA